MNVLLTPSPKPLASPQQPVRPSDCCRGILRSWNVWLIIPALAAFAAYDIGWGPPPLGTRRTNSIDMELVYIEPGAFVMGNLSESVPRDQKPQAAPHRVTITRGFYIGRTEVTQAQWKAVMADRPNPSTTVGDDLPVQNVSWADAVDFCQRLSKKEGKAYRLPTEAEWEFVSRAGMIGRDSPIRGTLQPTGALRPNYWGVCGMLGNVAEWCQDKYEPYAPGSAIDPVINSDEPNVPRVRRGGSYSGPPGECSSGARASSPADTKDATIGFRVVRER